MEILASINKTEITYMKPYHVLRMKKIKINFKDSNTFNFLF